MDLQSEQQIQMDFISGGAGRPRPKAGYRCKICGKEGGQNDSHWYQLCPYKGKTSDKKAFNPPRKGYLCKFCHKTGGEPDSHWFQQCPRRAEFEGVQVPHPLKLRTMGMGSVASPGGMMNMNMMSPQSFSQTTAAMAALNLGVIPQTGQMEYAQQFSGIFMYPNQMMGNPQAQFQQQQLLFLQQQLAQQQQKLDGDNALDPRQMFIQAQQQQRFRPSPHQSFSGDEDGVKLLNELAKKAHEMSFEEGTSGQN